MSSCYKTLIEFAIKITKSAFERGYEINFTASTTSIYMLLAMIHIGSKNKASDQLEVLLGGKYSSLIFNQPQQNPFLSSVIEMYKNLSESGLMDSQIFTGVPLRQEYLKALNELFKVTAEQISFQDPSMAVNIINGWVREKTHGRISSLIDESGITPETVMILMNTVYFKGTWKYTFDNKVTKHYDFYLENGDTVNVPFMSRNGEAKIYVDKNGMFQALLLEYQQEQYLGVFLLPSEKVTVKDLIMEIKFEDLKSCLDKAYQHDVDILIPKFKIDRTINLKNTLKYLGVTEIFNDGTDLSNMSDEPLSVEDIVHRSTVEVDEKGTVAAAASGAIFSARSLEIDDEFIANRPFIFLIVDKNTGVPLFINTINDPSKL